ncbi:MAG: hypothetical protein AAGB24_01130 [Bacteroidota bacterium]
MSESKSKSWLQRLKDESWEAELLVSAVAIYGIFQSFAFVDHFINFLINKLSESQYLIGYFIAFTGLLAFSILATMFVIHFILRSYWIGLVGLNSVFPDYSLKDSAYSETYTKKMMLYLPKLTNSIEKIDELCSVIFSVAFTLLGIYMYVAATSTLYLFLFNMLKDVVPSELLFIPLVIITLTLLLQSLLNIIANIKKFKSNVRIQNLFFQTVKVGSLLIWGPMAKNFLQVSMIFGSNFKRKKNIVVLVLLFFITGAGLSGFQAQKTNLFYLLRSFKTEDHTKGSPYFYASNNQNRTFLLAPEIDSDIVNGQVIKLFIPIFDNELSDFEKICGIEKSGISSKKEDTEIQFLREAYLSCYQENHLLHIDGKKISPQFVKYDHQTTGQFGILGYLNLDGLENGPHSLRITKKNGAKSKKQWDIAFYYYESPYKILA